MEDKIVMTNDTSFFDAWSETQKKVLENWVNTTKNLQGVFSGMGGDTSGAQKDVLSLYNAWIMMTGKSFDELIKNYPLGGGHDAFKKLFSGADAYVKLYEYWAPIYETFQKKAFDFDTCKNFFDPEKQKEIIDQIFGFNSPGTVKDFYSQASSLIDTWGASAQGFVKPWADAVKSNMAIFPDLMAGKSDSGMEIFKNMFTAFEGSIGKAFKVPGVGKDREKQEILMQCLDKYSKYLEKNTEFQHKMYIAGNESINEVLNTVAKMIKDGAEIKSYNEFFKLWVDTNEKAYLKLFETNEFSKLQAELLESALDIRGCFNKLIEKSMADFPVPMRSEMDDLYRTVYELKKKVRTLEKQVKEKNKKEVGK